MGTIEKQVPFGTKQEILFIPRAGYQVVKVEVVNKTMNETVPSQLTKTADNQWVCSFLQPAGVVAIHPEIMPILFSVIIEECEVCDIVLMESSDVVDVKAAAANHGEVPEDLEDDAGQEAAEEAADESEAADGEDAPEEETDVSSQEEEGSGNFNTPQHSGNEEDNDDEGMDAEESVEDAAEADSLDDEVAVVDDDAGEDAEADSRENGETADAEEDVPQDAVYDAGEFADELVEAEPVHISQTEYDEKCRLFWKYRDKASSGEISSEKFNEIKKKHTQFLNDVTSGNIVVDQPSDGQ